MEGEENSEKLQVENQSAIDKKNCDMYVARLIRLTDQENHYKKCETRIKSVRASHLSHIFVVNALSSEEGGPIYISAKQAIKLRDIIEQTKGGDTDFSDALHNYNYDHILCSRVLDHWNIRAIYGDKGCACYYMDLGLPRELCIEALFESRRTQQGFLSKALHHVRQGVFDFTARLQIHKRRKEEIDNTATRKSKRVKWQTAHYSPI